MSTGLRLEWRLILRLVLAFAAWNILAAWLLPEYARVVVPAAQWVLHQLHLHDAQATFTEIYPNVRWQVSHRLHGQDEYVSFRLLAYNLILYLALLSAIPTWRRHRIALLLTGLPLLFVFHVVDLLLVVESRFLTILQPRYYEIWDHFDPWFVAVKFYHSFSVMALKQVLPLLVLWLQWQFYVGRSSVDQDLAATA
jgi:hypothetical protein